MGQIVFQATLGGQTALVGQNTASSYSLNLPLANDTLVGKTTTDTLTNKTISGSSNTLSAIGNSSLTNSSITIGSTSIALGSSSTSFAGISTLNGSTLPTTSSSTVMVSGNMPAFSAYQSSAQSLSTSTETKLQFQTKEFDTANAFDNTTNYRFQPLVAGYYQVNGGFVIATTETDLHLAVYKNGSNYRYLGLDVATTQSSQYGSCLVYLNGSTDYIELYGSQGTTTQNTSASAQRTYFQATMVRSA